MSPHAHLDEKGHDTAFYLFHELYHCIIPEMQRRSLEDIRMFGVPDTGHPSFNNWQAAERREIMLPIARIGDDDHPSLIGYFRQGAALRMRQTEAKKVYDRIQAHLLAWKRHLTTSLNVGKAPLDDLRELDKLAHALYENAGAKYEFDDAVVEDFRTRLEANHKHILRSLQLAQGMASVEIVDGKFVTPRKAAEIAYTGQTNPDTQVAPRESLAPAFLPRQGATSRSLNQNRIQHPQGASVASLNTKEGQADPSVGRKPSSLAELMTRGVRPTVKWDDPA
jgi:hypothetical protein